MGLKIDLPVASSATMRACYGRVGEYSVTPRKFVHAILLLYWTQADREAEAQPADCRSFILEGPPADVTIEWVYQQLKLQPDLSGAADA